MSSDDDEVIILDSSSEEEQEEQQQQQEEEQEEQQQQQEEEQEEQQQQQEEEQEEQQQQQEEEQTVEEQDKQQRPREGASRKRTHADMESLELALTLEKDQHAAAVVASTQRATRLKSGLTFLYDEHQDTKQKLVEAESTLAEVKADYEQKLWQLQQENQTLRQQQQQQQQQQGPSATVATSKQLADKVASLERDNAKTASLVSTLQQQLDKDRAELQRLYTVEQRCTDLQAQVNAQTHATEGTHASDAATSSMYAARIQELEQESERSRAFMGELKQLRVDKAKWAILEEESSMLKQQLARNKDAVKENVDLKAQVLSLQEEVKKWLDCTAPIVVMSGDNNAQEAKAQHTPRSVATSVSVLQAQLEHLSTQYSTAATENAGNTTSLLDMQTKTKQLSAQVQTLQAECDSKAKALKRIEKRCLYVTKERDGLKAILNSYDEEDTLDNHDIQRIQRIQQLEEALAASEEVVKSLTNETATTQSLRDQNNQLSSQLAKVEREAAALEVRLSRGEYNPRTTKVLHMKFNPTVQAADKKQRKEQETIQLLQEENKELRDQVVSLMKQQSQQQQQTASSSVVMVGKNATTLAELTRKIEQLEKSAADQAIKSKRLLSVFQDKTREYREATYRLTGYKIEMKGVKVPEFNLRSMYATSKNDMLCFRKSANGDLHVLETEFVRSLPEHIKTTLTMFHSIPVFTSSVTEHLFQKTTIHQQTSKRT